MATLFACGEKKYRNVMGSTGQWPFAGLGSAQPFVTIYGTMNNASIPGDSVEWPER
jgi:hypothetical protein